MGMIKNKTNFQTLLLLSILIITFAALTFYVQSPNNQTPINSVEAISTDFKNIPLEDINGNKIYLSNFNGKVVVMEFMATWCITCAEQLPILKELQNKYESSNLIILSISTDPAFDTFDILKNYASKKEITWNVTRDSTLQMTDYFDIKGLSTIILVSPNGEVKDQFTGLTDINKLSNAINNLI